MHADVHGAGSQVGELGYGERRVVQRQGDSGSLLTGEVGVAQDLLAGQGQVKAGAIGPHVRRKDSDSHKTLEAGPGDPTLDSQGVRSAQHGDEG